MIAQKTGIRPATQQLTLAGRDFGSDKNCVLDVLPGLTDGAIIFVTILRDAFPEKLGPFATMAVPLSAHEIYVPDDAISSKGSMWSHSNGEVFSQMSPMHEITLTDEEKREANIPLEALRFNWSYPVPGWESMNQGGISQQLASFFQVGGFMYFGAFQCILQVTTLIPSDGDAGGLQFSKPRSWKPEWTAALAKDGRFQDITIKALRATGASSFCWLRPEEIIPGENGWPLHDQPEVPHGGFAYLFHKNPLSGNVDECISDCYFAIVSGDDYRPVPATGSKKPANSFQLATAEDLVRPASVLNINLSEHPSPATWEPRPLGDIRQELVKVSDITLLRTFQSMLSVTHKASNNWTRDRGFGPDGKSKNPVPCGYILVNVWRNEHPSLWAKYCRTRAAIAEECHEHFINEHVVSCKPPFHDLGGAAIESACNEWRLFHGSSDTACHAICRDNFRLELAGMGATWKPTGDASGTPLYGFGVYFAENITKSDEYSKQSQTESGIHAVLLCRVVGGRPIEVQTNHVDTQFLQAQVLDGPYHSVLGDRVSVLSKPYREFVVYNQHQLYPEYLIEYQRSF